MMGVNLNDKLTQINYEQNWNIIKITKDQTIKILVCQKNKNINFNFKTINLSQILITGSKFFIFKIE